MNSSPLVTVVVPLYNYERYVEECVQSVLNQTHENLQVIVVNNASTDSGPERVSRINDPRLEMLHIDVNEGIGKALNLGFGAARGDWIAYLPADDYWEPEFVRELVSVGQKGNFGLVGCWLRMVDESGQAHETVARTYEEETNHDEFDIANFRQFRWTNPIAANTLLWRADIVFDCTPLHENLIPCDWGMLIRATSTGCRMEMVRKALLNCRWHGGNLGARMSQRNYYIDYFFLHLAVYRKVAFERSSNRSREISECRREFVRLAFRNIEDPDMICRLVAASETGYEASAKWPTPLDFREWIEAPVAANNKKYMRLRRMAELGIKMEKSKTKVHVKFLRGLFRRAFQAMSARS